MKKRYLIIYISYIYLLFTFLDISGTSVAMLPTGLLELTGLEQLKHAGVNLVCDCQTTIRYKK